MYIRGIYSRANKEVNNNKRPLVEVNMTDLIAMSMAYGVLAAVVLVIASDITLQEWRFGHRHHD